MRYDATDNIIIFLMLVITPVVIVVSVFVGLVYAIRKHSSAKAQGNIQDAKLIKKRLITVAVVIVTLLALGTFLPALIGP